MKLSDSNTKFFHQAVKAKNRIEKLLDGNVVSNPHEVVNFYKRLQGTASHRLLGVDITVLRAGAQLSADDARSLCRTVRYEEIDQALISFLRFSFDRRNQLYFHCCGPAFFLFHFESRL